MAGHVRFTAGIGLAMLVRARWSIGDGGGSHFPWRTSED